MLEYLYVDFDAFFASSEQFLCPALRGKPVGVVAVETDTTCIIAASYQARPFGIKTGTPVREAKQRCPAIELVQARPALYVALHHELLALIERCIPIAEVRSIDEVLCHLHGNEQKPKRAHAIATTIKAAIAKRFDSVMTCSIGIASNPFLAKTASDLEKPNGLVLLYPEDVPGRLLHLSLQDLCGIGRRMEARLHRAGIRTVADLYAASRAVLRQIWGGIEGERFYAQLRGECTHRPPHRRRSVGHSHVLPPQLRTAEGAFAVAHRLVQKAAMRMRQLGVVTGQMTIGVEFIPAGRWERQLRLFPTADTFLLVAALRRMWEDFPLQRVPFHVWVYFDRLHPAGLQVALPLDADLERHSRVLAALDRINTRHGPGTLYLAASHNVRTAAPMRIAFTHIPDPATEDDSF